MYSEKERKQLEKELNIIKKCSGKCKECKYLHYYSITTERSVIYAWGCDRIKEATYLSNTVSNLKVECLDFLQFELS